MRAYVLVQTESGTGSIAARLRAIPGVAFAEDVRGPYDAIARAGVDPELRPLEGVIAAIRDLPGVTRAITAPLIRRDAEAETDEAA